MSRYLHGPLCEPTCKAEAVTSPLERDRPPAIKCPHCGAEAGQACMTLTRRQHYLAFFGRSHPSRFDAA